LTIPSGSRPSILVAEDDAPFRDLLVRAFEQAGCDVIAIAHGGEFIDYLAKARRGVGSCRMPRVIVTDIRMPGLSGLDVLHGLRVAQFPAAVIVITAFGSPETREQALALGAHAVFDKPFEIDDLVESVRALTES
jgi:CheY-like chemotaxis protein